MPDTFKPVRIFISDLHVALRGVNDPSLLREEARFLGTADGYRAAYAAGAARSVGEVTLVPPAEEELLENRFLAPYLNLFDAQPDPWLLQLPFVCDAPGPALRLSVPELGLSTPVRRFGWVWPCGWGYNLEIELDAEITSDRLLRLTQILRDRGIPGPFVEEGGNTPLGVSDVFRPLSERLAAALYDPSPGTVPTVDANYVIGVADPAGGARPYLDRSGAGNHLPSNLRQRLHSLLEGRNVTPTELAALEGGLTWQYPDPEPEHPPRMVLSSLTGNDFLLTRFERGTLVVATDNIASGELSLRQFHCLAANVRTAWQQLLLLAYTVENAGRRKLLGNAAILALAEQAQALLNSLPEGGHFFARRLSSSRHGAIDSARRRELKPPAPAAGAKA